MSSYRTALDLEPDRIGALFEVAMLLAREQDFAGAIDEMDRVLELDPDHAVAHERLAIWHYYLDDFNAAREHSARAEALGHAMPPQFKQLID